LRLTAANRAKVKQLMAGGASQNQIINSALEKYAG
jgi:hypothetical protein